MTKICCDKLKEFNKKKKVAKKWLPVEINLPIQDSANYPVIFKNCLHILKCTK